MNPYDFDTDKTTAAPQEDLAKLMDTAIAGQHSKFEFIKSFNEYKAAKIVFKSVYKIVKVFRLSTEMSYKLYFESLKNGAAAIELISTYARFRACYNYYNTELSILLDMMTEYRTYLAFGGIVDQLFGQIRPEEDLVDSRLPSKVII